MEEALAELLIQVRVQDKDSKVWDGTRIIIEAFPHQQYLVKLTGSSKTSICNRRHLQCNKHSHSQLRTLHQAPGRMADAQ